MQLRLSFIAPCRYIFHEVRGPLNNIGLGVELLSGLPAVQQNAEMKEIVSAKRTLNLICDCGW